MANNRPYLVNVDGDSIMVAKSFDGGWDWRKMVNELTEWLACRDMNATFGTHGNRGVRSCGMTCTTRIVCPK